MIFLNSGVQVDPPALTRTHFHQSACEPPEERLIVTWTCNFLPASLLVLVVGNKQEVACSDHLRSLLKGGKWDY